MKRTILKLVLLLLAGNAMGHARLKSSGDISPRNNNPGLKTAPCGGISRTNTPTELTAGTTITVEWEETINHPGHFEFYFSTNDSTFDRLKTVEDTQDDAIVGAIYHQYTTELTLPNVNCENCTIQMIQVMTDNPSNPSFYYSCADIKLIGAPETSDPNQNVPETEKEPNSEKTTEEKKTETGGAATSCH